MRGIGAVVGANAARKKKQEKERRERAEAQRREQKRQQEQEVQRHQAASSNASGIANGGGEWNCTTCTYLNAPVHHLSCVNILSLYNLFSIAIADKTEL